VNWDGIFCQRHTWFDHDTQNLPRA
jgi:hypothetical protein